MDFQLGGGGVGGGAYFRSKSYIYLELRPISTIDLRPVYNIHLRPVSTMDLRPVSTIL